MPQPRAVYEQIAREVGVPRFAPDPAGRPGWYVREQAALTGAQVALLDKLIQEALEASPGQGYDDVVRGLRLDGHPLPPLMMEATRRLRVARERRLL